ncbi:MAG TPA: hotdog fold domain-containing protein [Syntrophales bacterium]|nr:hotdog fold domain-containing protein [Syntrophales bacterium]
MSESDLYPGHGKDLVKDFLFGSSALDPGAERSACKFRYTDKAEGWVGIPHGGIGMGALVELSSHLRSGSLSYPFTAEFRMGGRRPAIGDTVHAEAVSAPGGSKGTISLGPGIPPYMESRLTQGEPDPEKMGPFDAWRPGSYRELEDRLLPLPFYRNCFVCGRQRSDPGLERRFYALNPEDPAERTRIVVSPVGLDDRNDSSLFLFRRGRFLHPLVFLALLDETLGWGGFLASAAGAVTVRIEFNFRRAVSAGERLVVFGRGEKAKGRAGSRLMFWASGGAAVFGDGGTFETVITASGQWYGLPELTDQLRTELIPADLTRRAFELAGAK